MSALTAAAVEGFVREYLLDRYQAKRPIPWFHREWWRDCCSPHPNVAIAAPRSHAKSTAINLAYSLAAALIESDPFQLKVSRTTRLAIEFLRSVKSQLSENEKLIEAFGILPIKQWPKDTEDDFICRLDSGYEFRMVAMGAEQPMRGLTWNTKRPTLIVCDDMEDDEQVINEERRGKMSDWFMNTLLPMGMIDTRVRVIGTILHKDSLLASLLNTPGWLGRVYQAHGDQFSNILWPEMFSIERLKNIHALYAKRRNVIGYNREYRNIAVDEDTGYFQRQDFVPMASEDYVRPMTYYVGGDLAISLKASRDRTCFVVGGMDLDGFLNVVDVRRGHWDAKMIVDEMFSIQQTYQPSEWYVEDGAIKKAMGSYLELRQRQQGEFFNLAGGTFPTQKKMERARSIQGRMRQKAVKFDQNADWYEDFRAECLRFTGGDERNDQPDALAWLGLGLKRMVVPDSEQEIEREMLREARQQSEPFQMGISPVTGY